MLPWNQIFHAISDECAADRVWDDVTAKLLAEEGNRPGKAVVRSRQKGVFSGVSIIQAFGELFQGRAEFRSLVAEGAIIGQETSLVEVSASLATCLSLERTLVNYLSHLSGVASLTRQFVEAVSPHPTKILATRKTLPGLKELQLLAVVAGGGHIHRRNLSDGILIKENHQEFVSASELIRRAKLVRSPLHRIEIEIQDLSLLEGILAATPDIIMLDNLPLHEMKSAVEHIRAVGKGRCEIEVSGGMTLEKVGPIAALGVEYISVGQLTHSAPSLNLSMDIEKA